MKKFMGKDVEVYLKGEELTVDGRFYDIDEYCIYLRENLDTEISIPISNICLMRTKDQHQVKDIVSKQVPPPIATPKIEILKVFVDGELEAEIPADDTDLSVYSDELWFLASKDPTITTLICTRTMKQVEYYPGKLLITTVEGKNHPVSAPPADYIEGDEFGYGPVKKTNKPLSPTEMAIKLNSLGVDDGE